MPLVVCKRAWIPQSVDIIIILTVQVALVRVVLLALLLLPDRWEHLPLHPLPSDLVRIRCMNTRVRDYIWR